MDLSQLGEDWADLPMGRNFTLKVLSEQMQERGSGARGSGNSHKYQPADTHRGSGNSHQYLSADNTSLLTPSTSIHFDCSFGRGCGSN